jgi:hypothetical protein
LTEKYFLLINFSNGKQTQESLESGFPETTFRETNALRGGNFNYLCTVPCTRKQVHVYFSQPGPLAWVGGRTGLARSNPTQKNKNNKIKITK